MEIVFMPGFVYVHVWVSAVVMCSTNGLKVVGEQSRVSHADSRIYS